MAMRDQVRRDRLRHAEFEDAACRALRRIHLRGHDGHEILRRADRRLVRHAHAGRVLQRNERPRLNRLRLAEQKRLLLAGGLARSEPLKAARRRRRRVAHAHAVGAGGHRDAQRAAERRRRRHRGGTSCRPTSPCRSPASTFSIFRSRVSSTTSVAFGSRRSNVSSADARQCLRREVRGQVEHEMRGDERVDVGDVECVLGHSGGPRRGRCVRRPTAGRRQNHHNDRFLHQRSGRANAYSALPPPRRMY